MNEDEKIKVSLIWESSEIAIEFNKGILYEEPKEKERFKHGISNGQFGMSLKQAESLIDELTHLTRAYRTLDYNYLKTYIKEKT